MLDTLQKNKTFLRYKNTIDFLTTGTKYVGNFVIGPMVSLGSPETPGRKQGCVLISQQIRTLASTGTHGYLAYGFKDQKYKGQGEIRYQFSRKPWSYINVSYKKDIDNGQVLYDQLGSDNIFVLFFRKPKYYAQVPGNNKKGNRFLFGDI